MTSDVTPVIYSRIERTKNDKTFTIRIQQLTANFTDQIIDYMCANFLPREPISVYLNLKDDEAALKNIRNLWRKTCAEGTAIIALVEDDKLLSERPTIAGCNITGISKIEDEGKKQEIIEPSELFELLFSSVMDLSKAGNLYDRYKVDSYLTALGLSVHADFQGIGLGLEILKAREQVCKLFGLKMTATVFTAAASQHIAAKAGFETLLTYEYKTYRINGKIPYENLPGSITLMALKY